MNTRRAVSLWLVVLLTLGLCALASAQAAEFDGSADNYFDSLGYYYAMTGGKFPNGQTVNGDNASGGTFRYILDEPAWGGYPLNVWNKDDWFPQNAGLALTMSNGGSVVFDNFNNDAGDFYEVPAGQASSATPGLYRGYCMSNNWDWIYSGYFKLNDATTVDEITGYFDENSGFDRNSPHIGYRMNIWSNLAGDLLPAVDSFTGDMFSSDSVAGTFVFDDTGVDRVFGADYGYLTDDIFFLTYQLDSPLTLPAGEYWFSHDAIVTTPIIVAPAEVIAGENISLSAVVTDDAGDLQTACYTLDGGATDDPLNIDNNPSGWDALTSTTFSVLEAGEYNVCAFGKDSTGAPGPEVCATLLVHAACDNPAPWSQGYWHRQCLGVPAAEGGIDPGRHGRGPGEPLVPEFDKLMADVGATLESKLAMFGGACAAGMDADPASDPCERAKKQYTALLFNQASGGLQMGCGVDLASLGCTSSNVLELIDELAGLIIGGECNVAAACAAAVNEGSALVEAGHAGMPAETAQEDSTGAPAVRATGGPEVLLQTEFMPRSAANRRGGESGRFQVTRLFENGAEVAQEEAELPATDLDALLTALSGGYDPELRLKMVKALIGKLDVAYDSLLAEHLRAIHREAVDFEQKDVAQEAERILQRMRE